MEKISRFIVEKRKIILLVSVLLALISTWLMTRVNINYDMSEYLPNDSSAKIGKEIMEAEFPAASSFNLLFKGLTESEKTEVYNELLMFENVQSVLYEAGSAEYNKDDNTLYIVNLDCNAYSPEAISAVDAVTEKFSQFDVALNGEAAGNAALNILPLIAGIAFVILVIILIIMCSSWIEPLLFLITIAVAIVINMGTNVMFDSVSDITFSIAAILQLVLSMDYSIMLLNRYRQEKLTASDKFEAMRKALRNAFAAISSSSITTIVGMLALVFMSFTIGKDMGFSLAKGVLLSLLSIFTVLPALILIFDRQIEKTVKKSLHIKMNGIASFSYSARYVIPVVFLALFAGSFFLKGAVGITYTLTEYYEVNSIFTMNNPIVVLYENSDENAIAPLAEGWEKNDFVDSVNAYATTIGKELTASELAVVAGMDEALAGQLFYFYFNVKGETPKEKIALGDFMQFLINDVAASEQFKPFLPDDFLAQMADAGAEMNTALEQFVGDKYSRLIINTSLAEESDETFGFVSALEKELDGALNGKFYLVGNSVMAYEMNVSFPGEMNLITILTVIAIFLVVAVAFRSLSIPLILVCVIQCAVFFTMGTMYLQGSSIYYLPLLIVQCLLMGATIDYGILYTSYYREARAVMGKKEALAAALNNSIHTIMTSASILIMVTAVLGVVMASSQHAISEILLTIARGGLCSTVLVVFMLPGIMSAFDRFVVAKKKGDAA